MLSSPRVLAFLFSGTAGLSGANVYFRPATTPVVVGSYSALTSWSDASGFASLYPGAADTAYISGFVDQLDSTVNVDIPVSNSRLILSRKVLLNLNRPYSVYGRTDLNTDANVTVAGGTFTTSILNFLSTSPDVRFTISADAQVKTTNTAAASYSILLENSSHLDVLGSLTCPGPNFGIGVDAGFPHMTITGPRAFVSTYTLLIATDSGDTDKIAGSGDLSMSDGANLSVSSLLYVGLDGVGTMEVKSGSTVNASVLSVGRATTGVGTMVIDGPGTSVHATTAAAGALRVGRDGSGVLTLQNGATADTTSLELGYAATASGTLNVDGEGTNISSSGALAIGGSVTAAGGAGSLNVTHGGTVFSAGPVNVWKKGSVTLDGGTLKGASGIILSGASLAGSGTIRGSVSSTSGNYTPGTLFIDGSWDLSPSDSLQLHLHKDASDGYDSIEVNGPIHLNGAKLDVALPKTPSKVHLAAGTYTLIKNTSGLPISGGFAGIKEGDILSLGMDQFAASYMGGESGNDFTLTVVPPPVKTMWKESFFNDAPASVSGDDADPDSDGISNFWERAYGLDPLVSESGSTPQLGMELKPRPVAEDADPDAPTEEVPPMEGFITMTYRKNLAAPELTFQVKWSDDLSNWSSDGVIDTVIDTQDGVEIHEAKAPVAPAGGSNSRYLILEVKSPDAN